MRKGAPSTGGPHSVRKYKVVHGGRRGLDEAPTNSPSRLYPRWGLPRAIRSPKRCCRPPIESSGERRDRGEGWGGGVRLDRGTERPTCPEEGRPESLSKNSWEEKGNHYAVWEGCECISPPPWHV